MASSLIIHSMPIVYINLSSVTLTATLFRRVFMHLNNIMAAELISVGSPLMRDMVLLPQPRLQRDSERNQQQGRNPFLCMETKYLAYSTCLAHMYLILSIKLRKIFIHSLILSIKSRRRYPFSQRSYKSATIRFNRWFRVCQAHS